MVITDRLTLTPLAQERPVLLLITSLMPIFGAISLAALGIIALPTAAVAAILMLIFWNANQAILTNAAFDELDQDVSDIDAAVARAAVEARATGAPVSELKPDTRARIITAVANGNLDTVCSAAARIYFGILLGIVLTLLLSVITPEGSTTMHLSLVVLGFLQIFAGAIAPTVHAHVHLRNAGGSGRADQAAEPHLAVRAPLNAAILSGGFVMLGMASIMRHAGPALTALLG